MRRLFGFISRRTQSKCVSTVSPENLAVRCRDPTASDSLHLSGDFPTYHYVPSRCTRADSRGIPITAFEKLSSFRPPSKVNLEVRCSEMTFGGCIVYCKTAPEVEQATMELLDKIKATKHNANQISLGFDIEWRPTFKRGVAQRKAAVIQICIDSSHCYVMHIIHSGIPPILKSLLEDFSSVKVGICIANDATKILRDYNVSVEPLEELSGYANLKLGGAPKRWSLRSLTEMLTCKQLAKPKKIRLGNWEATELSREQLLYAATDAFASWHLYQVLKSFPDAKSESEDTEKVNDVVS